MPPTPDRDGPLGFGYKQVLDRSLSPFASFAAGFSYLSILTGMFQTFYLGYGPGGPAFFWTWPAVFLGQLLVALCFAELATHYPLAGSVYQWSKHTGSWAVGWMAGWVYLASYVIAIAAVALALQVTLQQIAPWSQVFAAPTWNAVFLGCLLIGFTTVINAVGVAWMARVNNVGVFTELAGAVLLIILLAGHAVRGPSVVFDTQGRAEGRPFGYFPAFLAAAVMASYVMYGFDIAGDLAEETRQARRRVPWSILQALAVAATLGALLILTALMAAPDLHDGRLAEPDGGLPQIVREALGSKIGTLFLWDVIFAVTVCTLAVHAAAVRLMFAMARDNNLPFARALARVSGRSQTPILPAVLIGVLALAVLLLNVNSENLMQAVVAVSIVWANLAYLLVTAPLLVRRLRGWPGEGGAFRLGKWGIPVNAAAVVWSTALIVNMSWPRPDVYGQAWHEQFAAVLFTTVLVVIGGLYYAFVQRYRTGVLTEHRSEDLVPSRSPPRRVSTESYGQNRRGR